MSTKKKRGKKKSIPSKKIDALEIKMRPGEKTIEQLHQDLKEKNDKLLRAYADLQNYQKRMEKEVAGKEDETKKKYLSELLDVYELLQKAYEDENPKQGLKLLLSNLEKFFEKECVTYIECKGKTFDHVVHHAISTIEKDDCDDGTIIDEVKKGYLIGDKLLRPAQVIVVKNKKT